MLSFTDADSVNVEGMQFAHLFFATACLVWCVLRNAHARVPYEAVGSATILYKTRRHRYFDPKIGCAGCVVTDSLHVISTTE
jgi:hypothetical protein